LLNIVASAGYVDAAIARSCETHYPRARGESNSIEQRCFSTEGLGKGENGRRGINGRILVGKCPVRQSRGRICEGEYLRSHVVFNHRLGLSSVWVDNLVLAGYFRKGLAICG
jgi:hypothetical protein